MRATTNEKQSPDRTPDPRDSSPNGRVSGRRRRLVAVGGAITLVVTGAAIGTGDVAHAATRSTEATTTDPFDAPSGMIWSDGHLWVADKADSSLTEVNSSSGSSIGTVVRTVKSGANGLDSPAAVFGAEGDLWVANEDGSVNGRGSVTELQPSDGDLVRTITGSQFGFYHPVALRSYGTTLLVLDAGAPSADPAVPGSLKEINTSTGALIRTVSGTGAAFDDPTSIGISGKDAWITDTGSSAVTEVDVTTGDKIRTITGGGLHDPDGVATNGSVWVADDESGGGLSQINETTGAVERTWTDSDADYGFNNTLSVISSGPNVYVATPYSSSPMVTDVPVSNPGAPAWYMCNTNGPYYFSSLSAFAVSGANLWVASRTGANWQGSDPSGAATGSLTELNLSSGALVGTMP